MPGETNRITASLPILGKVSISFYSCAERALELYKKQDEFKRQKDIRHLGLISNVFEGASHTRYEYVLLQAGLTDLLDNIHKGSSAASQGSLMIEGKEYPGNGLIKTWLLLSNFGHLKNTIGDEKSLLLFSLQQPGFKSQLLSPIHDNLLRNWSESTIERFDYVNFHHILSIRRIYKELPRQLDFQNEIAKLYKLLLIDIEKLDIRVNIDKLEQLRRLFRTIRALAIVTIDGHYSHTPISIDLISMVLSIDSLENSYKDIFLLESIRPILSSLHENIYLDKKVLASQRDYEIRSLEYLKNQAKTPNSYEKSINKAFEGGLVSIASYNLKHFARFPITKSMQPNTKFYDEFRNLQTVKRKCPNVEASLDTNPITETRYADFFINPTLFDVNDLPRFIYNICLLISAQVNHLIDNTSKDFRELLSEVEKNATLLGIEEEKIESILKQSNQTIGRRSYQRFKEEVFPSFKDLFWSVISYFIKESFHIDIDSQQKKYDIFGMKFPVSDIGLLDNNINKAMLEEKDDLDRLHELKQLSHSCRRKYDGFVFVCLARIIVYDPTKAPSERLVTDIDSSIIKITMEEMILELNESKNTKKNKESNAVNELRKRLVPVLNNKAKGYRVKRVKGFGGKLVIKCCK